jgi:hypothetical protein
MSAVGDAEGRAVRPKAVPGADWDDVTAEVERGSIAWGPGAPPEQYRGWW